MADYRWYVAQALPGLESTAIYHLKREGVVGFAPAVSRDKQCRIFPGYVFVELEDPDEAGIVNRTRGIHKMLPIHANTPLALPVGFIEELRDRLARGSFDEDSQDALLQRFIPGEEVSACGMYPLRDGHGRFIRYHKGAGIVLGYLLGREIEVRIPLHQLSPTDVPSDRGRGASRSIAV